MAGGWGPDKDEEEWMGSRPRWEVRLAQKMAEGEGEGE